MNRVQYKIAIYKNFSILNFAITEFFKTMKRKNL